MAVLEVTSNLLLELKFARAESDRLFGILTSEAIYERPIAQRHRVVFYIGHLEGFDYSQVCRQALGMEPFNKEFDSLFQFGIDPDPGSLPSDTPANWPSLERVNNYVTRCRRLVDENLERAPDDVVLMALEHRQMHLETLAYMFHNFAYDKKKIAEAVPLERTTRPAPQNKWIGIPAGEATLGKPNDGTFGWDNEFDEMRVAVPAFRIQQNSVTNGEYLRFVEAGAAVPHFWLKRGDNFMYRGMFEEIPLPLDWPVYASEAEAEAYAKWIGKSIPTEQQFHRAAYGTPGAEQRAYPWGSEKPSRQHGNFDFHRWDPEPVDATPAGQSAFGVNQLLGNGWEWTSTVFGPLPGFKSRPTYPGYSSNFFDGEHNVIKGGSPRTAGRLLRRSFRNWFRRDYAYVYATFRCVEN